MLFNRVSMSSRAQSLFGNLKYKTGININILARYGIVLSLKDTSLPNPSEYDESGMELRPDTLFGNYDKFFHTLFIYRLHNDGINPTEIIERKDQKGTTLLQEMMRAHLNRGASILFPRITNMISFHHVIRIEQKIDSQVRK